MVQQRFTDVQCQRFARASVVILVVTLVVQQLYNACTQPVHQMCHCYFAMYHQVCNKVHTWMCLVTYNVLYACCTSRCAP